MREFLIFLGQGKKPRSRKTILNYHVGLSALWTWAIAEGVARDHVVRAVPKPKPEKRAIVPFTQEDVSALLASCEKTRRYRGRRHRGTRNRRPSALRDKAILLLLLDTGIRAGELCGMDIEDVDIRNRRIFVMGKGAKERMLPLSPPTVKAVWRYLTQERADARVSAPLIITRNGLRMDRIALLHLLYRLGDRAGIPNVHPHRFRHTFAVEFLRNGGNAYALQMALGHSTLEMVRNYLALVQADLDDAHRRASPVDNWRL